MKSLFFSLALFSISPMSFAADSCLSDSELVELQKLQAKFAGVQKLKPGCEKFWGAAACLGPAEDIQRTQLLSKQKGEKEVCEEQEEELVEDSGNEEL